MIATKSLVVDANILLRAVFGVRVRNLFEVYGFSHKLCAPESCFAEARRYIPHLAQRRSFNPEGGLKLLENFGLLVESIGPSQYDAFSEAARARISHRDPDDWPIVATALLFDCPIWTEDHDFLGCGVATWTTQTVEMYLRDELPGRHPTR